MKIIYMMKLQKLLMNSMKREKVFTGMTWKIDLRQKESYWKDMQREKKKRQKSLQRPRLRNRTEKEDIMRDAAGFSIGSKTSSGSVIL
jgi:hypothetical protein